MGRPWWYQEDLKLGIGRRLEGRTNKSPVWPGGIPLCQPTPPHSSLGVQAGMEVKERQERSWPASLLSEGPVGCGLTWHVHHATVTVLHQVASLTVNAAGGDAVGVEEIRVHGNSFAGAPWRGQVDELLGEPGSWGVWDFSPSHLDGLLWHGSQES